jgi:hypothetical protein
MKLNPPAGLIMRTARRAGAQVIEPDELAGVECGDRGGARRQCGQRLAVVAGEVKTLAAQTSKATTDISQQIATMQESRGR